MILYPTPAGKIVVAGDSRDTTWDYILGNFYLRAWVTDVQVLVTLHYGRDSDRSFKFLDLLRPRVTLFGSAKSEHLARQPWSYRYLMVFTNISADSPVCHEGNLSQRSEPIDLLPPHFQGLAP